LEAFKNYIANHKPAEKSRKGYIQWQGSRAQTLLLDDIKAGRHKTMTKEKLYKSKPEYQELPLKAFRDKVHQELRTAKHCYTQKHVGRDPRKASAPAPPVDIEQTQAEETKNEE
jgi:hypothetical protein